MGAKVIGKCKLCDEEKELQKSHLIPKFIFRWLKKTGVDSLRSTKNINIPRHDGNKEHLLCFDCEQKFSKHETPFAENIFKPIVNNEITAFQIDDSFIYFMISIFWRFTIFQDFKKHVDSSEISKLSSIWKDFLNDGKEINCDDNVSFHLYVGVDDLEDSNENFVRYISRVTDLDYLESDSQGLIFFKLPRMLFFCFYRGFDENEFINTQISSDVLFDIFNVQIHSNVIEHLVERANYVFALNESKSENQKQKTLERVQKMEPNFRNKDLGKLNEYLKNRN